jgi:hypothetical protein
MIRIYTLSDPRTNQVFYIGASSASDISILCRHTGAGAYIGTRRELRKLNLKPIIDTIETANNPLDADFLETYWIWQFRSWGFNIENKRLDSGYKRYYTDKSAA